MNEKNVTPADIARTGLVTNSAVSLLFSSKTKSLSFDMCRAISLATDIPLDIIYRKAGLLPPSVEDPDQAEIDSLLSQLEPDLRQQAKDYLYMLGEKQAKRRRLSFSPR